MGYSSIQFAVLFMEKLLMWNIYEGLQLLSTAYSFLVIKISAVTR